MKPKPLIKIALLLACLGSATTGDSQTIYTVGDYTRPWSGSLWGTGIGISTVFGSPGSYVDGTFGQTFRINNVNALVRSISFPLWSDTAAYFQAGVAAWNGSGATGPLLYLSDPLLAGGNGPQNFTVSPSNLSLNQGQQYILFLTPNAFVNSSPTYNTDLGAVSLDSYTDGTCYFVCGIELSVNDVFNRPWTAAGYNMAFSIDYQAVPEPAAVTLLLLGSAGLCWRYRSRRPNPNAPTEKPLMGAEKR